MSFSPFPHVNCVAFTAAWLSRCKNLLLAAWTGTAIGQRAARGHGDVSQVWTQVSQNEAADPFSRQNINGTSGSGPEQREHSAGVGLSGRLQVTPCQNPSRNLSCAVMANEFQWNFFCLSAPGLRRTCSRTAPVRDLRQSCRFPHIRVEDSYGDCRTGAAGGTLRQSCASPAAVVLLIEG